jgi:hypothetical protein
MKAASLWSRGVFGVWAAAGLVAFGAIGCGDNKPAAPAANGVFRQGPVQPAPTVVRPLPDMVAAVEEEPASLLVAAPPSGYVIDARVLVITADGSETELPAIQQTLDYLGTPYDVLNASQTTLTASTLASGTHGKYNAILLTTGNLALSNGNSAFTSAEFQTLATYEGTFQVRRVSLYTFPDSSYGYSGSTALDTSSTPLPTQCTSAGAAALRYVNCGSGVSISGAYAYRATASDSTTVPLLMDSSGLILAATRAYGDGREAMSLNFSQSPSLVHTLQLFASVISWATRGVFFGDRHAYIGIQIDDLFIPDTIYNSSSTFRMSDSDLQAAFDYQNAKRSQTVTGGFKYNWAFNAVGASSSDALTAKATQIGSGFNWISHTWDHTTLDPLSYSQVLSELTQNTGAATQFGLKPYSVMNLVPPSYSGLTSSNPMQAMFDSGIRYVVCDSSVPGDDNPTPNAGIYNQLQPQILMVPRRPTNLFFDVSTPDEWMAEYNDLYRSYWGRDLSYSEILDAESDVLVQYLLKGENDPWMFHQPDLRIYSSGQSLLGDLLDQTLGKYTNLVSVPLVGPTMEVLGQRVANRMQYNASGVSGTIDPNANNITIHVANAATVPVTGACGGTTELYAGQPLSSVSLNAGASATLPLSSGACGGSGGSGGTGGSTGGTGGSTGGTGGSTGGTGGSTGGTGGTGGSTGGSTGSTIPIACTTLTVVAGSIGAGQTAANLATAQLTGTTDVWDDYVELSPASQIVCNYNLPSGVSASSVTALALDVNYRGQAKTFQTWTFEVLDPSTGSWTLLGDNTFATGWVWTTHTFAVPMPASHYFSSGTLQIRYGTTSNADASDVDQLLIRATIGGGGGTGGSGGSTGGTGGSTGGTGGSTGGTGGSTGGTGGSTGGTGGSTGGTGGTGTSFTLPCASLSVATGSIGDGQTASALTTAELTGTTDVWTDYVELSPSSSIICNYNLPSSIAPGTVSSLALQVNYRGQQKTFQTWTFEVRDTTTGNWTSLGDNGFAAEWVWTKTSFSLPAPLTRFFSSGTLQIRYGTTSNVDASDIDQLVITGTH